MLTAIYHMLKKGTEHEDLGADHFDRRSTEIKARRLAPRSKSSASRSRSARYRKPHGMKLPELHELVALPGACGTVRASVFFPGET
jgi:hypothetical protein